MSGQTPPDGLSPDTMEAIRLVFFEECEELLGALETALLAMQGGDTDAETINAAFRAVHSVKGGAAIFELTELIGFAHKFENGLSMLRSGQTRPTPAIIKTLLRAGDLLTDVVRAAREGGAVGAQRVAPVLNELTALINDAAPPAEVEFVPVPVSFDEFDAPGGERQWLITFRPYADLYAKANDPLRLLRELRGLGPVEVMLDESSIPLLSDLNPEQAYLTWTVSLLTESNEDSIRSVFEFVEGDCDLEIVASAIPVTSLDATLTQLASTPEAPAAPAPTVTKVAPPAPTIRVDLDRVDRLVNIVSEMVINQAMLAQRVSDHGISPNSSVASSLEDLERLTRDLQDHVMAIRTQPVKTVFQRMSRLVREMEMMTGKSVHLETDGEGTEVDRTIIERLTDPLTHMVRNAIDHGLETPEKRREAGKPAQGIVKITAAHRGGRVVIEVCDDGAGIDRVRVRDRAIANGLISADAVLTEEETDALIFAPGFSTAETVSDVSGRGVGMDVVLRSVQELGGRISVTTERGRGSTFALSLPLTLAVLDGMVVSAGGQSLVVPITALVETVQPQASDIRKFGPEASVLAIRGAHVPLVNLAHALGYQSAPSASGHAVAMLVEDDMGHRAALMVDDIIGQRQVVIKSLQPKFRDAPGIAAATILGDGRVALILDINDLIQRQRRLPAPTRLAS